MQGRRPVSADFRLRDLATYEEWYVEHAAPGAARRGRLRAARAATATRSRGADARRQPGLLPDGGDPRARAAGARRPDRRRGHRRQDRRLRARAARATDDDALRLRRRERHALRRRHATATRRRSSRSSARSAPTSRHVHPAPACRSTRASWSSCYVTPTRAEAATCVALLRGGLRRRAVRRARRRARRACATCARRTSAASTSHADARTGKVLVFAAIDNLWKGTSSQAVQNLNLMFGRDETRGPACEPGFFRSRWVEVPERRRARSPARRCRAGFRAAGVAGGHQAVGRARRRAARLRRAEARRAPRASRARARCAAPVLVTRERAPARRAARRSPSTPATPTRRPAGRGLDEAARMQGAAAMVARRRPRTASRSARPA